MKLTRERLWLSVFLLVIFQAACQLSIVSNLSFADGIQPGWTKAQVETKLGKPTSITQDVGGSEIWIYNMTPKQKRTSMMEVLGKR